MFKNFTLLKASNIKAESNLIINSELERNKQFSYGEKKYDEICHNVYLHSILCKVLKFFRI